MNTRSGNSWGTKGGDRFLPNSCVPQCLKKLRTGTIFDLIAFRSEAATVGEKVKLIVSQISIKTCLLKTHVFATFDFANELFDLTVYVH